MSEPIVLTPEEARARKGRNFWLALAIGVFVLLVFAITIAKMKTGAG